MRWQGRRESGNVEDRRSANAGMGIPIPLGRGGLGIGGIVAVFLISWALGIDPMALLGGGDVYDTGTSTSQSAGDDEMKQFVSVVLADTEDTWNEIFSGMGRTYREPHLVLFSGAVNSACGTASAAVGPFYCPGDERVYIDLSFYDELRSRFGAPGDFAQAYVIAHEVGHHVQKLLGISARTAKMRSAMSERDANALSVRVELQADCFAGIWAHYADRTRDLIEAGDIDEALNAATAIGDDTLQREAGRRVAPDSFTHGSSRQRVRWFKTGYEQGTMGACDTFTVNAL